MSSYEEIEEFDEGDIDSGESDDDETKTALTAFCAAGRVDVVPGDNQRESNDILVYTEEA